MFTGRMTAGRREQENWEWGEEQNEVLKCRGENETAVAMLDSLLRAELSEFYSIRERDGSLSTKFVALWRWRDLVGNLWEVSVFSPQIHNIFIFATLVPQFLIFLYKHLRIFIFIFIFTYWFNFKNI